MDWKSYGMSPTLVNRRACSSYINAVFLVCAFGFSTPAAHSETAVQFSFDGAAEPSNSAIVANQISGVIIEVSARPGESIQRDDLLFRIDDKEFAIAVERASAKLAQADADLELAQDIADRQARLRARGAGTAANARQSAINAKRAEANVLAMRAELAAAKLALSRAEIRSAVSGIVTEVTAQVGQFVEAEAGTHLARVITTDPIRVKYDVPYEARQKAMRMTGAQSVSQMLQRVRLAIIEPTGAVHPHEGKVAFESAIIDPETGMLATWATVPNPKGTLRPGLRVKVKSRILPNNE